MSCDKKYSAMETAQKGIQTINSVTKIDNRIKMI